VGLVGQRGCKVLIPRQEALQHCVDAMQRGVCLHQAEVCLTADTCNPPLAPLLPSTHPHAHSHHQNQSPPPCISQAHILTYDPTTTPEYPVSVCEASRCAATSSGILERWPTCLPHYRHLQHHPSRHTFPAAKHTPNLHCYHHPKSPCQHVRQAGVPKQNMELSCLSHLPGQAASLQTPGPPPPTLPAAKHTHTPTKLPPPQCPWCQCQAGRQV
jgi:hypothetical protein